MNKNKLILPITILIASFIFGSFYYASQLSKQESIERQQQIELQARAEQDRAKLEQEKKEYIVRRKKDCYDIETSERKKFNNVDGSFYNQEKDVCVVRYTTNEYKGVNCKEKYKDLFSLELQCELGIFTKEF